jgi:hypothetical protein
MRIHFAHVIILFAEYETALIAVVFVGKFGNILAFDAIYIHSAEMFPTCIRTLGLGTCSLCGRVGALLSPIIAKTVSIRQRVRGLTWPGNGACAFLCLLIISVPFFEITKIYLYWDSAD